MADKRVPLQALINLSLVGGGERFSVFIPCDCSPKPSHCEAKHQGVHDDEGNEETEARTGQCGGRGHRHLGSDLQGWVPCKL
jgi:hypothetical protein